MTGLKNNILNNNIAGDTSNILVPDTSAIKNGIEFKSNINSNVLNGYYNLLSESIQYLQFTGGLYSEEANYDEGNIASLVIKNGEDYSIWQFRRNANNPQVLNNNPPITGASITTVNGVDAYEGGTLNTDWDKLTEDYAIEATANTVMGRDGEGASNVNMPSSITNTSIVNNEYLQQKLQEGLAAKQDKLTAGTNIEISEDNVISASGDLATRADLVTYDNSNTNLEYISGYDFPKFKTPIPDTINLVLASSTSASITKQEDGSYLLQSSLNNIIPMLDMIFIPITSIEDQTKRFGISNILLQFFDNITIIVSSGFSNVNYTALKPDECSISEIDSPLEFALCEVSGSLFIIIKRQDDVSIPQANYTVTLNIKNKVLRNQDSNLFYLDNVSSNTTNIEYNILSLEANESNTVVTGTVTNLAVGTISGFYIINNIVVNYFNLDGDYITTSGITSSSGKTVEYKVVSAVINSESAYIFGLKYTDGSEIQQGDVFTFNLTPDKNSTLDPIYSPVANVQQAIEVLIKRYNIPLYCYVYPEDDGTFDDRKRPANYYYNLFGVTTVWKKRFADKSTFFRTEGTKANNKRIDGFQAYGITNITGTLNVYCDNAWGAFFRTTKYSNLQPDLISGTGYNNYGVSFNSNKAINELTNDLAPDNYLIEVYELVSINGINIWGEE